METSTNNQNIKTQQKKQKRSPIIKELTQPYRIIPDNAEILVLKEDQFDKIKNKIKISTDMGSIPIENTTYDIFRIVGGVDKEKEDFKTYKFVKYGVWRGKTPKQLGGTKKKTSKKSTGGRKVKRVSKTKWQKKRSK